LPRNATILTKVEWVVAIIVAIEVIGRE